MQLVSYCYLCVHGEGEGAGPLATRLAGGGSALGAGLVEVVKPTQLRGEGLEAFGLSRLAAVLERGRHVTVCGVEGQRGRLLSPCEVLRVGCQGSGGTWLPLPFC